MSKKMKEGRKETAKERLGNMRGHISFEDGRSFENMSEEAAQAILDAIDKAVTQHK